MRCVWQEFLRVVPLWMRQDVDRQSRETLQELRLRLGHPPELVCGNGSQWLDQEVSREDLQFVVNTASRYSPWSAATISQGYITAAGGHRIGMCGEAVVQNGTMTGIREVTSLCLRVARDFPGIAAGLPRTGSLLIIGSPGAGKTTLLRDLIRCRSDTGPGSIAVVDERGELFPRGFATGKRTDVLWGCSKEAGIEAVLRTMGPGCIAVDEITAETDCRALRQACGCGVHLLATAHAASRSDLETRTVYSGLLNSGLFDRLVILQQDKSWRTERM